MFIKELKITNFKNFSGEVEPLIFNMPNGELGSGLNIFVGENNTGKSTIFEAFDFIRNGTKKSVEAIKNKNNPLDAKAEVVFEGDINSVIDGFSQENKVAVFKKYIYGGNEEFIKFSRSTDDIKAIKLWSEGDNQYKNESGIDAPAKKLFEANFVWADTNPNEEVSFGSSTICGNLLKEISKSFIETPDYREFTEKFHETFNSYQSGLKGTLRGIEEKTQKIFKDQFGDAEITFRFEEVKTDVFFKNADIDIDDGCKTPMREKGSGMQRAVSLAMLQVYAEELVKHPEIEDITKPFYLFIDEPEICLHPKAQQKLLAALLEISKKKQIFLSTHSPYFIATKALKKVGLFIFKRVGDDSYIETINGGDKLLPWSPTWGEINYRSYQLATIEFHDELYGRLQEISGEWRIPDFDAWLEGQGYRKIKQWTKENNGVPAQTYDVTLQTFIRHKTHHPENVTMQNNNYSEEELGQSIEAMIEIIRISDNIQVDDD